VSAPIPPIRRRALFAALIAGWAGIAIAGPVEVYREGARYCPHDRASDGAVLTETQAIDRARTLLPDGYCGPSTFVSGCEAVPERALGSWRIYFHQYRLRDAERDWSGLTHTYVVLDARGNCYANIPGTEQGAPR
jgi:hypothetical protein